MKNLTDSHFKLMSTVIDTIPFNKMIGLSLQSIENNTIQMSFTMTQQLIGNYFQGILHGGVISTVLDMAGGTAAIMNALKHFSGETIDELSAKLGKSSTINLNINFLRPGKGDFFITKAAVLQSGKKITFTSMSLFNSEDELIAAGTGSYFTG
ncbi:MAG: thioesterase family protein [Gammaproteobacteria bacterium]|nr:thioesterase family protein [Gammaproteobacteria bacterium]